MGVQWGPGLGGCFGSVVEVLFSVEKSKGAVRSDGLDWPFKMLKFMLTVRCRCPFKDINMKNFMIFLANHGIDSCPIRVSNPAICSH